MSVDVTTITVHTRMHILDAGQALPLDATLTSRDNDPYAITATFPPASADSPPVAWTFARDLLTEGLEHPAGIGDVLIRPDEATSGAVTLIGLTGPEGHAVLAANTGELRRFLDRTYATCPPGAEHMPWPDDAA